jgi:hypothetical protein
MLVEQEGYANFYFNKLEQDRLFARLKSLGDPSAVAGTWSLIGKTSTGDPVEFMVNDTAVTLELGKEISIQQFADALKDDPPGSGGLLVAMQHWRKMFAGGNKAFDEVYYLGHEPLDGTDKLVDVLIATAGACQSRWYFDTQSDALAGFDLRLAENADECEVRFVEWRDVGGHKFPAQIAIKSGGTDFATMTFEKIAFKPGNKNRAKPADGGAK